MAGRQLPTGTVTFLFTDVEGSTKDLASMGNERYADVLDDHRQVLRDAFEVHDGVEVGTEGDAFFVAFARAPDAVGAAAQAQRALASHELRVRMGVHTGDALVREDSYVGHDVHRAKRICDAGHGGQILVSQTTADLLGSHASLTDLGPHRLKDLEEAQRIFQVTGDGLQRDFPPLRSLEHFTTNLPLQRSTFVGREREIADIRKLLDDHRLVTLTGIGGCGKTRLALQVGAELLDAFSDGVFFVDLAPITASDGVVGAIATAVGLAAEDDVTGVAPQTASDTLLVGYFSHRTCLLILDNCEHLLDACADVADRLLGNCPSVTILVTSREGLAVQGEQLWQVPSLSLPADLQTAQTSEAVSLFKARALAVRPAFELTPNNIGAVTEICRRLDGIPLAIEFAAARISHLPPQEIAARLEDMFRLLTGGRGRVQRQQTLQAALDWSFDLLSVEERVLLRRLAVFTGSFAIDAVEGICADDDLPRPRVLDVLGSLVAKSLVVAEEEGSQARYRQLETVRLYAIEQLREAGEVDSLRTRHREFFVDLLLSFDLLELWLPTRATIERLGAEEPNLLAATDFAVTERRFDIVVSVAMRRPLIFLRQGRGAELLRWLSMARTDDLELSPIERASALAAAANTAGILQDPSGPEFAELAVEAAGEEPSIPLLRALRHRATNRAIRSQWTGDLDLAAAARADVDRVDDVAKQISERAQLYSANVRPMVELMLGDIHAALDAAKTSRALELKMGQMTSSDGHVATTAHLTGDHELALEAAEHYIDRHRASPLMQDYIPCALAAIAAAGQVDRARTLLASFVEHHRQSVRPATVEMLMVAAAAIAYMEDDHPRSSRLLGWVRANTIEARRIIPSAGVYAMYQHYVGLVRSKIDSIDARRYLAEAREMSEDGVIALALADH